jgi:hypothetical protein
MTDIFSVQIMLPIRALTQSAPFSLSLMRNLMSNTSSDQAYEALLWIVPHPYGAPKPEKDIPAQVTWSAGKMFEVVTVTRQDSPNYTARLSYWGPMLVQARMRFPDGYETQAYVYARRPSLYHAEAVKS